MYTERTPFYLISVIFLLTTIILSFVTTFNMKKNISDYFPEGGNHVIHKNGKIKVRYINDSNVIDKLCWYFSQLTHHTLFYLLIYFFMALINKRSERFFKMIGPLSLTVSVMYFCYLFPKQKLKLHQLSFYNFFSHFMIIFLVFCEFLYIDTYHFHETTNCFFLIISSVLFVYINYYLRRVWSYNLLSLDTFNGWKLVSITTLLMYIFSLMFYIIKFKNKTFYGFNNIKWSKCSYSLYGLINILYFLIFTLYNDNI